MYNFDHLPFASCSFGSSSGSFDSKGGPSGQKEYWIQFEQKMNGNLKIASILFVLVLWGSMMVSYPPLLVLGALPFILINRIFLVPFMILVPLIEGGFILPFPVYTETLTLLVMAPLLAFDIFVNTKNKAFFDSRYVFIYIAFLLMAIFGSFVAFNSAEIEIKNSTIIKTVSDVIGRISFFFFLYIAYVQLGIHKIRMGLQVMQFISVPFFIGFFIYMNYRGIIYGYRQYLNFGYTSHGTWSVSLIGLSAYLFYRIIPNGRSFSQIFWAMTAYIMSVWIVISSDSRNGLLSLVIMLLFAVFILRGTSMSVPRALVLFFAGLASLILVINSWNKPLMAEFRQQFSSSEALDEFSNSRTSLWAIGIRGFLERPLTGHGGAPQITRQYARKYIGKDLVLHNTIIEVAFQYGIVGLFLYLLLQARILKGFFEIQKRIIKRPLENDGVFLLPFITYFSLIFSALFISWLWRSIVWGHISLLLAIITLHQKSIRESPDEAS